MKQKNAARVAIILVNYNNAPDTIRCLTSLKKLDHTAYTLFVCDNCSTDDSWKKIQAWVKKQKNKIELLSAKDNQGFAAGNNIVIHKILKTKRYGYVWLLNNDTTVTPQTLTALVQALENDRSIGIAGSQIRDNEPPYALQSHGGTKNAIYGTSMFIRSKVLKQIGLLDENYFMLVEDIDFSLRAKRAGWRLQYVPQSIVYHRKHASTGDTKKITLFGRTTTRISLKGFIISGYYFLRNNVYYARKFYPILFPLYAAYVCCYLLPKMSLAICLLDQQKLARLHLLFAGLYDGLIGRMGKRLFPEYEASPAPMSQ